MTDLQVHDSSDTASAGSPANTLSGSTISASVSSSNVSTMPASYQQSAESKVEKISEMAVVSLVPPTTIASVSQAPSTSVPTGSNKEDYDSSATVRVINVKHVIRSCSYQRILSVIISCNSLFALASC